MAKKFQVVYDLGQYNPVLTPIATELEKRGWTVVSGKVGMYNRDKDVLGSVACQSGPWIRKKPLTPPSFFVTHSLTLNKRVPLPSGKWSYVVVSGEIIEEAYTKQALSRKDPVEILGLGWSKMDVLINNRDKQQEFKNKIREIHHLDTKPIILFAPTYRKKNHEQVATQLPGQPEKLLEIVAALPNYNVIFVAHGMCDYGQPSYEHVVPKTSTEKYKYILGCDLMISDTSGITVEFGLLDKPIVLLDHPNYEAYFKACYGQGVVDIGEITALRGLKAVVDRNIQNPAHWHERRAFWVDKAAGYCDGNSTKRIVDKIEEVTRV